MTRENILIIFSDEDWAMFFKIALLQEGFEVRKLNDCTKLLNIASIEKPDLVIIDQRQFNNQGGYEVLKKIKDQGSLLPVIIKWDMDIDFATDTRKFMQAGVCDYLQSPLALDDLVKSVNNVLKIQNDTPYFVSRIVETLLARIRRLDQTKNDFIERCEWYEKHRQKLVCNCQKLINQKTYEKPKTTSFRKLGRASDGFHIGFKFICDVCQTAWFCGESHTESEFFYFWEPADENVELVELDSRYHPKEPDDYEPH